MMKFIQGDIFESKAQTLVATVNCVGIMGKGLAKEFKERFPEMFKEYARACKKGELRQGVLLVYNELNKKILCFPTKDNWKGPSKYEFIEAGLKTLCEHYKEWGITSIAIPPLGSGLGGLDWKKVRELIIGHLQGLPIEVEVYEPLPSADKIVRVNQFKHASQIKLTPDSVYTGEIIRLARASYPAQVPIGRLLIQKIAFFAQMAGLPIKLNFEKYYFGPFDHKFRFNVDKLDGLFIRDLSPIFKRSNLVMLDEPKWLETLEQMGMDLRESRNKIQRAIDFLKEFSLPEAELMASALWAWIHLMASGQPGSKEEIADYIKEWKFEKFSKEKIFQAVDRLAASGWLSPPPFEEDEETYSEAISF